ncbi:MAG: hypothetical protein P1U36_04010 [Legionellaceae bacterium]|nr:hypothetical protein [Legionellaceae bacterium]
MKKIMSLLLLFLLNSSAHALPFNIVLKDGVFAPTTMTLGYNPMIYYTVSNNTGKTLNNAFVRYLPPDVSQITTGGTYSDTCGATFNLEPNGGSCTLQLEVSAPVDGSAPSPSDHLFVCLPGGKACAGAATPLNITQTPWGTAADNHEIVYTANVQTNPKDFVQAYISGGTNPVPDEDWDAYVPPSGFGKNAAANVQADELITLTSPGSLIGKLTYITTSDSYTWYLLANVINATWPYDASRYTGFAAEGPFQASLSGDVPLPGTVSMGTNYKAQILKFYANEHDLPTGAPGAVPIDRYFILDQWGNEYIMHNSLFDTPAEIKASFEAVVLPPGWSKSIRALTEDLITHPVSGLDSYVYINLRDAASNNYHQISWGESGTTLASQIQDSGMPIWGGHEANQLNITQSFDQLIYGGGGATEFYFSGGATSGTKTIANFNPDADTINLDGQTYSVIETTAGTQITLSGGAVIILSNHYFFDSNWIVS